MSDNLLISFYLFFKISLLENSNLCSKMVTLSSLQASCTAVVLQCTSTIILGFLLTVLYWIPCFLDPGLPLSFLSIMVHQTTKFPKIAYIRKSFERPENVLFPPTFIFDCQFGWGIESQAGNNFFPEYKAILLSSSFQYCF